jgi:NADH-quinone oxidoreductase subunit A
VSGFSRTVPLEAPLVSDYLSVVIYLGLILGFAIFSLAAARLLRPRRPFAAKMESYECGAEPVGPAWVQFPVGFYLVALVFIVFDALAVFLFPWVLNVRGLGLWGILAMLTFLATLSLGWVYAYRERIFEWK